MLISLMISCGHGQHEAMGWDTTRLEVRVDWHLFDGNYFATVLVQSLEHGTIGAVAGHHVGGGDS